MPDHIRHLLAQDPKFIFVDPYFIIGLIRCCNAESMKSILNEVVHRFTGFSPDLISQILSLIPDKVLQTVYLQAGDRKQHHPENEQKDHDKPDQLCCQSGRQICFDL